MVRRSGKRATHTRNRCSIDVGRRHDERKNEDPTSWEARYPGSVLCYSSGRIAVSVMVIVHQAPLIVRAFEMQHINSGHSTFCIAQPAPCLGHQFRAHVHRARN